MMVQGNFRGLLLLGLILMGLWGCTHSRPQPPAASYYLTSEIAYLRDNPTYEGNVLAQVYKGDQVEGLGKDATGWLQVRSVRTGQTGWIQGELLSPQPVPVVYFIALRTVRLRECPQEDCPSLQLLYRGDQVQKIEQNDRGWWRVVLPSSRTVGWLPAGAVSDRLEEPQVKTPPKVYYYVAVLRLKLRSEPLAKSTVIKTLELNDQVEKLDQHPEGWLKVRLPVDGLVGWVASRYLSNLPVSSPRRPTPAKKPSLQPPEKKEEVLPQPEIM
jgi:uncharacterized protein YgiM (DUF1202 family)